jgi:ribA/ribD-fused uncharacterized protein
VKDMINKFEGKYDFLSNFYPSQITIDSVTYPTVEHAFQAAKTRSFLERIKISRLDTPGKAKRAGRQVELRSDWEKIKDQVMYDCLKEKFKIKELREKLLATGNEELIEGTTWHDNYWGNCSCEKCKNIEGKNMLGKTLMRIREELRNE